MAGDSLQLYVLASLALILTPGQDMIYVVSRAVAQGRLAGTCSALGVSLGILVHTVLAALGAGAVLQASETLFMALKIAGAVYLAWLGMRMMLAPAPAAMGGTKPVRSPAVTFIREGVLSNLTNPKIAMFFFAFLPQFVDPSSAHPERDLAALGVLYAAMAFPVKASIALAAASLSPRDVRTSASWAWLNRACGGVMVGLAARLLLSERDA